MTFHSSALVLLAAWFGLLTGFGEVSLLAIKKFFLDRFILFGPNVVWMAPLANLILFSITGLVLCVIAWRWPRLISLRLSTLTFTFIGFLSLLFMYYPIHVYAKVPLAAGLAAQTSRLIAAHPEGFYALVRRTTGWLAVMVIALAASLQGWQGFSERRALAKLPPALTDAPNVLLIVLDTVRAQSLGLHGYSRPTTPQLERMAKTGVRFERAIATAPWTLPSHASMFTGRFPNELSADWLTPLDATYPTLAEVLRAHGYVTAGFVANLEYTGYETGLNRGFVHYQDYQISPEEILLSSSLSRTIANYGWLRQTFDYYEIIGRRTAADINRDFLRWISGKNERPFFAFLNYYDAHEPYLPPAPFDESSGPKTVRKNFLINTNLRSGERSEKQSMSPQEIRAELDAYESSITYLDHQLGLLTDGLQKRGILENTLVVITSDHGEQFAENGLFSHGNSLYLTSLHVPLLIVFSSRVPAGISVTQTVSLRDLPATVVDLIGLKAAYRFPGNSLARYWTGENGTSDSSLDTVLSEVTGHPGTHDWYPTTKGDMKSLVGDRFHYIKNGDDREELYNLENDPLEQHNLARSQEGLSVLSRFRTSLKSVVAHNRSRK